MPANGLRVNHPYEDITVDEFFSTVPGKNFDLCIISTRILSRHFHSYTRINYIYIVFLYILMIVFIL